MKRITVTITEEKCVEYTQLAAEQGHTLGSLCSFLLQSASITFRTATISAELMLRDAQGVAIDPDEAGDCFGMPQSASQGVAETPAPASPLPQSAPQGVVTAPVVPAVTKTVASALDVSTEEAAAFAARRAESDRKRRVLVAAMGITHPDDAPLPARFFPGEADFIKAHPELA